METKFGDRLRRIRLEREMSQEEFADLLGTTKQVISRYETNQRTPKITTANEYAEKLGMSIGSLLGWEDITFPESSAGIIDIKDELESLLSKVDISIEVKYGSIRMDETAKAMLKNTLQSAIDNLSLIVK